MNSSSTRKNLENTIRKFRKKLRQIDNLERIYNRVLSDEEEVKVDSKYEIRKDLKQALEELALLSYEEPEPETEENINESYYLEQRIGDVQANDIYTSISNEDSNDGVIHSNVSDQGAGDITKQGLEIDSADKCSDNVLPEKHAADLNRSVSQKVDIRSVEQEQSKSANVNVPKSASKSKVEVSKKTTPTLTKSLCRVYTLEGHSDLITAIVAVGDHVITASRDTTLRCWNITQGSEEHIFGGHTETVTSVVALDKSFTPKIDDTLSSEEQVIVSGSFDCSLKFWSLNTGKLIKSIYTFNPVTCICLCQGEEGLLVTGSEGGKLELWDLENGINLWSKIVFEGPVTGIKVCGDYVFSASACGVIHVHQLQGHSLTCMWQSENLRTLDGRKSYVRHVRSLERCLLKSDCLMYGDDSRNIKLVDWKKGVSSKVVNHSSSFSSIDALCMEESYMVSSSYDLDSGLGYINVRSSLDKRYLGTIDDEDTGRIVCFGIHRLQNDNFAIISGGVELKVWEVCVKQNTKSVCTSVDESNYRDIHIEGKDHMIRKPIDSESEISDEETEDNIGGDSDEEDGDDGNDFDDGNHSDQATQGWGSWCQIL